MSEVKGNSRDFFCNEDKAVSNSQRLSFKNKIVNILTSLSYVHPTISFYSAAPHCIALHRIASHRSLAMLECAVRLIDAYL